MKREKKGILERLAAFWNGDGPETDTGARLIRRSGRSRNNEESGGEMRKGNTSPPAEERKPLWKGAFRETGNERGRIPKKMGFSLAAGFGEGKKDFFAMERAEGPGGLQKGQETFLGTGRGKPGQKEDAGKKVLAFRAMLENTGKGMPAAMQMFLWEGPEEIGKRKSIPLAGNPARKQGRVADDEAGTGKGAGQRQETGRIFWKTEEDTEKKQDAARMDIDRLMREMGKRLWEEREGSGRRLGG